MVVDLKPSEASEKSGKKKTWENVVPVLTPDSRRKKAICGSTCLLVTIIIVGVVIISLAVGGGYFAATALTKSAKATIKCKEGCDEVYQTPHCHGQRQCGDRYIPDYDVNKYPDMMYANMDIEDVYYDAFQALRGTDVEYTEYIEQAHGVYKLEIKPSCDVPPTYMVVNTNTKYTAVKAQMDNEHGYHCMLIENMGAWEDGLLDDIADFEYDNNEFDLHIQSIMSKFFDYGEPVPDGFREHLGKDINDLCPLDMPFFFMTNGENTFESQVRDLLIGYDVEYDDIFYFFVDVYEAMEEGDISALQQLLGQYWEILGFLPDGAQVSDESPTGVGWSVNVQVWRYYDAYFNWLDWHESAFTWSGSLFPEEESTTPVINYK